MTRIGLLLALSAASAGLGNTLSAQSSDLARRIGSAPDGIVKMTYAVREGVCGDGRSFIGEATSAARGMDMWFLDGMSMTSVGSGDIAARCVAGPVRLLLVVRDQRIVAVQPFVGPTSPATERPGTDLGTVAVADVSRYLLGLAAQGREEIARNAILAATIADSVRIAGQLATLARNKSLPVSVRESALRWVGRAAGREGDRDALQVARVIAEDSDDRAEVRERAIRVIGEEPDGTVYLRSLYPRLNHTVLRERTIRVVGESGTRGDIDWVRRIALDSSERTTLRERAVRVIGEASSARALRDLYNELDEPTLRERVLRSVAELGDNESRTWLRQIVERRTESQVLRERAIRSLAEMGDLTYLRSSYRSLDDDGLRERILRSVVEGGGSETTAWLREIVRDSKERSALRERAVRSLAESGAATSELVSLYDAVPDRVVRDRLVNLLAERGDRAARDKLRSIASDDPDEDLRRRAVRKLAETR